MVERIRDFTVAEAIAAEAGTEQTPGLVLGEVVTPVIALQPRPPLAVSGYFPGIVGDSVAAVALNTSHVGLFVSGGIVRLNEILIFNQTGGPLLFDIRRLDGPATGFTAAAAVPAYTDAGGDVDGDVFRVVRSNDPARQGELITQIPVEDGQVIPIRLPAVLNNGSILVCPNVVDTVVQASFIFEHWPAIRQQPPG